MRLSRTPFSSSSSRRLAKWLVIDIHENLATQVLRNDAADVDGFEVAAYLLPDHLSIAVDHGDAVGAAEGKDQANVFQSVGPPKQADPVEMAAVLVDLSRTEPPSQ